MRGEFCVPRGQFSWLIGFLPFTKNTQNKTPLMIDSIVTI